jgi:hypothetical protein
MCELLRRPSALLRRPLGRPPTFGVAQGHNDGAERSAAARAGASIWRAATDDDEHYVYAIAL